MPIGMPGCPDFAASTASIASARRALASSPSDAGEIIIGERKLYSAHERPSLLPPRRFRATRALRITGRRLVVRVPRHRPAGRARTTRSAPDRRPAGAGTALLGQAAV